MKKVLRRIWSVIRGSILFIPTMLWFTALLICGVIISIRNTKKRYPEKEMVEILNMQDLQAVAAKAWEIIATAYGHPEQKWDS